MESKDTTDESSDQARDAIQFACELCHVSKTDTLQGLGLHLQEMHQVREDMVEISEEGRLVLEKTTHTILASWHELVSKPTNGRVVTEE